jgi:hypothetical protein
LELVPAEGTVDERGKKGVKTGKNQEGEISSFPRQLRFRIWGANHYVFLIFSPFYT